MRLIIVRHAETEWNNLRIIQGCNNDTALNEAGISQAAAVALALKDYKISAVISSPLKRALDTAGPIAGFHNLAVIIEGNLKEIDAGSLDGLSIERMRENYQAFLLEWRKGSGSLKMPGGESMDDVQKRAMPVVNKIVRTYPDKDVVIVSHVFTILSIICGVLNIEIGHFRRFRQETASYSIVDFGQFGTALTLLNETCHLKNLTL